MKRSEGVKEEQGPQSGRGGLWNEKSTRSKYGVVDHRYDPWGSSQSVCGGDCPKYFLDFCNDFFVEFFFIVFGLGVMFKMLEGPL